MSADGAEPDDRALLRAHVEGDPAAFGTLFTRHRDRLWAVALRTTGDREEAADALQDAMVAAFRRADSFRGEAAVTTWLHRIVVNACLDRLRRSKVRRTEPLPDQLPDQSPARSSVRSSARVADTSAGPVHRLVAPVPASAAVVDPADLVVDRERRTAVLAALSQLPLDQRAALVLVDMEGYSVQEAAAILECAPGTVKSRCSRGRARLLPLLVEHQDDGPTGNRQGTPRVEPTPTTRATADDQPGGDRP